MKIEELKKIMKKGDVVYGYTKYIKQLDCAIFAGGFESRYPGVSEFWYKSSRPQSRSNGELSHNPNTRAFKAFLIHTALQGGTVYFISNEAEETSDKFANERVGECSHTFWHKQITKSELAFICRYWDMFFHDKIKFLYFDPSTQELTKVVAPWKNAKGTWVSYYEKVKNKQERQSLFYEMFVLQNPLLKSEVCVASSTIRAARQVIKTSIDGAEGTYSYTAAELRNFAAVGASKAFIELAKNTLFFPFKPIERVPECASSFDPFTRYAF